MLRTEMHTGFWCGNPRERDNLEDARPRWKDNVTLEPKRMEWENPVASE